MVFCMIHTLSFIYIFCILVDFGCRIQSLVVQINYRFIASKLRGKCGALYRQQSDSGGSSMRTHNNCRRLLLVAELIKLLESKQYRADQNNAG
jgi:hypothetical protein